MNSGHVGDISTSSLSGVQDAVTSYLRGEHASCAADVEAARSVFDPSASLLALGSGGTGLWSAESGHL